MPMANSTTVSAMRTACFNSKEVPQVNLFQWILELITNQKVPLRQLLLDNSMTKINFMELVELHALVLSQTFTRRVNLLTTNSMDLEENLDLSKVEIRHHISDGSRMENTMVMVNNLET
jgi:hypothetical protein